MEKSKIWIRGWCGLHAAELLLAGIVIAGLVASCSIKKTVEQKQPREDLRPWQSAQERTAFMFALSAMIAPDARADGSCIDRVHREREAEKKGVLLDTRVQEHASFDSHRQNFYSDSRNHHSSDAGQPAGIVLVQEEAAADPCEPALRTCGNCHLPRENNCNYAVYYDDAGTVRQTVGQMLGAGDGFIEIGQAGGGVGVEIEAPASEVRATRVPIDRIVKTAWINGGDPLITWWNFERFNKRGEIAHKMLSIATEHNVACTNCHMRHGDFRLTDAGKEYFRSGRVIRNEPLQQMLVEH